jgi:hypothetical protein
MCELAALGKIEPELVEVFVADAMAEPSSEDAPPDPACVQAIRDELLPWALGLRDPVRERVQAREDTE